MQGGMVRVNSLTLAGDGNKSLLSQEKHGRRLDGTSAKRRVRDETPLVYRTLDLRDAYDEHIEGAKMSSACRRPVLHMIIRFPPSVLHHDAPDPFLLAGDKEARKRLMLDQAVRFANESYGGNAVFAARVDRDEEGKLLVDLLLAPRYEKVTKHKSEDWISTTKHGKDLARKHEAKIRARFSKIRGDVTRPRYVGVALQEEYADFFERANGVRLTRKIKDDATPDRLEVEAFKTVQAAREEVAKASEAVEAERGRLAFEIASAAAEREELRRRANNWIEGKREELSSRQVALTPRSWPWKPR